MESPKEKKREEGRRHLREKEREEGGGRYKGEVE